MITTFFVEVHKNFTSVFLNAVSTQTEHILKFDVDVFTKQIKLLLQRSRPLK